MKKCRCVNCGWTGDSDELGKGYDIEEWQGVKVRRPYAVCPFCGSDDIEDYYEDDEEEEDE